MNKERRSTINDIQSSLDDIEQQIQEVMDEEQDAFDNLPESLQYADRGEAMTEAIDTSRKPKTHSIPCDNTCSKPHNNPYISF